MPVVEAVSVGRRRALVHDPDKLSAIDKRPVAGRVVVGPLGPEGDEHASHVHGGLDQAVYAFAREDYAYWEAELGRPLAAGAFGENLTTGGIDVQGARIGERWRVGEVLLELSGVRIPCAVFAGFMDEPQWVRRFTEHGVPGAYFRVIEPGTIGAGDPIAVVERRDHHFSVGFAFRAATTELDRLPELAAEQRVGGNLRSRLDRYLARR